MYSVKTLLATLVLCLATLSLFAQTPAPPKPRLNTAYLEIGGPLAQYSLNYERRIPLAREWSMAVSAGVIPKALNFISDPGWGFDAALKGVYQRGKNRFTAGLGYSHFIMEYTSGYNERQTHNDTYVFAQLGYNRVTRSGFSWGVYYTPLASLQYEDYIFYWPALQLGYTF